VVKEQPNVKITEDNYVLATGYQFRAGRQRINSAVSRASKVMPVARLSWDDTNLMLSQWPEQHETKAMESLPTILCKFAWADISAFAFTYRPFNQAKAFFEVARGGPVRYLVLYLDPEEALRIEDELLRHRMERLLIDSRSGYEQLLRMPFVEPYYSPGLRQLWNAIGALGQIFLMVAFVVEVCHRMPIARNITWNVTRVMGTPMLMVASSMAAKVQARFPVLYYAIAGGLMILTWPFMWAWWIVAIAGLGLIDVTLTMYLIFKSIETGLTIISQLRKYSRILIQFYSFIIGALNRKKRSALQQDNLHARRLHRIDTLNTSKAIETPSAPAPLVEEPPQPISS